MTSPEADARAALTVWNEEPAPGDETRYTPWAKPGWHSWNAMSPEVEICDFFAALTGVLQPRRVIETGTGQGFMTRRIERRLRDEQQLVCFESSQTWRKALQTLDFFDGDHCALSLQETPDDDAMAAADLCFLDSDFTYRVLEITRWWQVSRPGAVAVIHDTGNDHAPEAPHAMVRGTIVQLRIPGFFLANPRGAFVGVKPPAGDTGDRDDWAGSELASRLARAEADLRDLRATRTFRYSAPARRLYGKLRRLGG